MLQPLTDLILVKPYETEKTTDSGIVYEESQAGTIVCANVLAAGPDTSYTFAEDVVYYPYYCGEKIQNDGQTLFLVKERNLIAKLAK